MLNELCLEGELKGWGRRKGNSAALEGMRELLSPLDTQDDK
jgi:hypothetical protein